MRPVAILLAAAGAVVVLPSMGLLVYGALRSSLNVGGRILVCWMVTSLLVAMIGAAPRYLSSKDEVTPRSKRLLSLGAASAFAAFALFAIGLSMGWLP